MSSKFKHTLSHLHGGETVGLEGFISMQWNFILLLFKSQQVQMAVSNSLVLLQEGTGCEWWLLPLAIANQL